MAISSASEADFTNIITPETQTIIQGNSATLNVTLTASNGFSSEVTLEVSGLPTGVTSSFDDNTITPTNTANLTLTVSDSATAGNYTITVTGTGGGKTHADTTVLTISNAPDFTMELSPSSKTVVQGSSISYQLSVTSLYGFNSAISLSLAGLPTGASASYNDSTRYVTINTLTTTPIGSYTLLLTGTSAGKTHSATGYMNVNTLLPNFSANPSSGWEGRSITIGASGYPSSTTLYLKWDGSQIASYTTGDDGTISSTFTVPAGATRTRHYLTLTNSDGSYSVSNVAFDVVGYWQQYTPSHYNKSISTSSKEGSYCEENTLIISGTGFPENAPLVLYENDVYKLSFTSNSYGNFSQKITIGKTENKDNAKTYSYKVKTDDNWLTSGSKKFTQLTSSSSRKAYPIVDSGTPSMQVSLQGSLKSNSLSVKWDSIDGLRAVNANLGLSGGTTDIGVSDLQVDCIGNISKGYITIPGSGRAPAGKHALTFSDGIDTWYQSFYVFYSSYGWNAMESSEQVGFLDQLALKWYGKKFATLDDLQRSQIESMARGFNNGVYDTRYLESLNSYGTVEDVNIEITLAGQSCSDDSFSANYLSIHKALASGTSPCVVALNDTNSTTYELPNPTYGGYTAIYVDTQGIPGVIQAQQHPKNKEVTYAITLPNNAMIFLQNEYVDSAGQKHQTTVSLYTAKGVLYVVDTWGDFNKMTMINTILTALQNGKKVSSSEVNEFLKQQKKQNKWGAVGYEEDSVEVAFEDVCKNNPYLCKYTDDGSGTGNVWIIGSATAQITTNGEGLETAQVTTAGGGLGNNDPSIINKALAEGNSASYLTNYINITANKTVALMITDPLGRHIGWDPVTDVGLNELSNAIASHAKDSIDGESRDSFYILNNIIKGKYILRAYALEDGEYNINVNIPIIDKVVRKTFTGTAKAGDIIDGNIEVDWDALTPTQLKTRKILSTGGIVFGSILGLFVLGWALWHWRKYHNFKLRLK
ncbi:hypothetical protein A3F08_00690 [Candidatus Berkelbacteria bacterium RIFCSPHIGHO2_12_FULL_36_9]|uniref:Uncharacterized protein n=1 Tax=Candidatus Berkelbacteria bacterium RIFCSPHIGHO2_12_FULL_36_9 TaxID=1797469 RepID=A0A1F5EJ43_9BACT|nr:MAG: hypothetical protein A3F08_00690 [Candidatus Berkelbacteria bacterium RIFCSPHIGHO2_12_FULL_36_9]